MAINRIAGQMLNSNLERDGVDLAIDTNFVYFDVANNRVGINTATPTVDLDVNGNILANNLSATANISAGNASISGVASVTGNVVGGNINVAGGSFTGVITGNSSAYLGTVLSPFAGIYNDFLIASGNITGGNLITSGQVTITGNATAGNLNVVSDAIAGNFNTTGNVVAGNILVGNIVIPSTGNIDVGNTNIANLAEPVQNQDATTKFYVDNQLGNIGNIGNLSIVDTTIGTTTANADIYITTNGTGIFQISGTAGFVIPAGNTAQRPDPAIDATLRFNTETQNLELYDSVEGSWDSIISDITNQVIVPDGSSSSFILDKEATAPGILVSINGLVQVPGAGYSYTVTGNVIAFAETPEPTDIIDVRFL